MLSQNTKILKQQHLKNTKKWAINHIWVGLIPYKGLAIIANSQIKLEACDWLGYLFRNYLPVNIKNNITLLAI